MYQHARPFSHTRRLTRPALILFVLLISTSPLWAQAASDTQRAPAITDVLQDEYTFTIRMANATSRNEMTFIKKDGALIREVNTTVSERMDVRETTEWARTGREILWERVTYTKDRNSIPVSVHLCRRTAFGIYITYEEKEWINGELITDIHEETTLDSAGNPIQP